VRLTSGAFLKLGQLPSGFREVRIGDGTQPDDWYPAATACYDNVDTLVQRSHIRVLAASGLVLLLGRMASNPK
jgi:hypothetical protein